MSPILDTLTQQALALPADERYELIQRVWSSIEDQYEEDEELFAEIERRNAEMEAGVARTYSHDEVIIDARKAIGE